MEAILVDELRKDGAIARRLASGRPVALTMRPEDGNSMCGILDHGCVVVITPVESGEAVQPGDIVFVRWKHGNYICHLVKELRDAEALIANSSGYENGWAPLRDILGKVTEIKRPEV